MKLKLLIVFTSMLITCSECAKQAWLPGLMDNFSNKTKDLTKYIRNKGIFLKTIYTNKRWNDTELNVTPNEISPSRKTSTTATTTTATGLPPTYLDVYSLGPNVVELRNYIKSVQSTASNFLTAITPKKRQYKCANDNPIVRMTTPQLIASTGFPAESHTIVTNDGYILTVHRIPHSKNWTQMATPHRTVLLHHGLLGSSADWVIPGPEKGLPYILSEAGYDVWLANVRGNTYSRAHVNLDINSAAFWNFTFHEVSQHDLPAVIDYILSVKGEDAKINYIGHSMGTTVLFALLSTQTHYNKILRAGFALAPVGYMSDIKSPIRLLAKFSNNIDYLLQMLGVNEFLPQNTILRWLSKHACEVNNYEEVLCENSLFVLCGHDAKQFNRTLLPLILGHVPAGASTKTLIHYAQEIKSSGQFQQFDYGPEGNMKQYGSYTPPRYPVQKITLPIALFSAQNDWLSSDVDVSNLYVQLANPIQHYIVPLPYFNHIDFLWAIDAPTLVYSKLLQLLEDGVSRPTAYFDLELDSNSNAIPE